MSLVVLVTSILASQPAEAGRRGSLQATAGRLGLDVRALMGRGRDSPEDIARRAVKRAAGCGGVSEDVLLGFIEKYHLVVWDDDGVRRVDAVTPGRKRMLLMLPWLANQLCRVHRTALRASGDERSADDAVRAIEVDMWNDSRRIGSRWPLRAWPIARVFGWAEKNGIHLDSVSLPAALYAVGGWLSESWFTCHVGEDSLDSFYNDHGDDPEDWGDVEIEEHARREANLGAGKLVPAVQALAWRDDGRIDRLVSLEQFAAEGNAMNHCIGGRDHEGCNADGQSLYRKKSRDGRGVALSYRIDGSGPWSGWAWPARCSRRSARRSPR